MVGGIFDDEIRGTWVWYYIICPRQVWLMAHSIEPDEDNPYLEYGRFLHERALSREGEEVQIGVNRLDRVRDDHGEVVVVEIKKSSRAIDSARMQLAHYLRQLEIHGVYARGELRFPEERRKETVYLTDAIRDQLEILYAAIRQTIAFETPPPLERKGWCTHCAYHDFCWS